jgi:hypothetical protein
MARLKSMLAGLAAAGLVLAQPTAAFAQDSGDDEDASSLPEGSGAVIGILGLLGLVFVIMAITDGDDNNDVPQSA